MQSLIVLLGFVVIVVMTVKVAVIAVQLDAALSEMSDEELADECWKEQQDGHYPNPFSVEMDRREQERHAALVEGGA
jgi:hypothetical protein